MEISELTPQYLSAFEKLFTDYYTELGCDDDCAHLLSEYVLPDFEARLLQIYLCKDEDVCGFIIFQRDDIDNDWNFKEGWGDIRELYVSQGSRKKGFGKALVRFAEGELGGKIYTLPTEESEPFFMKCGYSDSGEYCAELDNKVFTKN